MITATQYVVLFKTEISQVSSVFNEIAFHAVLSMSVLKADSAIFLKIQGRVVFNSSFVI